jgi:hypothetical protein
MKDYQINYSNFYLLYNLKDKIQIGFCHVILAKVLSCVRLHMESKSEIILRMKLRFKGSIKIVVELDLHSYSLLGKKLL